MTFETSDKMRNGGFYGICKRGFIQWSAGRQAKGMTRWFWSFGPEHSDEHVYLGWSCHVPGLAISANFRVR